MKIQCDVCERAEATVLCCADEAALCRQCDEQVHAANKLASQHERVPLIGNPFSSSSSSSQVPSCDICQEKGGYFFCLEDRALLCEHCNEATHTARPLLSTHQRFLITGVRVGLDPSPFCTSSSSNGNCIPVTDGKLISTVTSDVGIGEPEGYRPEWAWNELFDGAEFDNSYDLSEPGSSCKSNQMV